MWASPLKSDEQVQFQTATARLDADLRPQVQVTAMVYEQERRPGLTHMLARYLDLDIGQLSRAERDLLYARTQLFRIDAERGKDLRVRFASDLKSYPLARSNEHGRTQTEIRLPPLTEVPSSNQWLSFELQTPRGDRRHFRGRALLLTAQGLSVVSDIDDTIKDSQVRVRRELLLNTFARPFKAVPDMAKVYQQAAARSMTTAFHYVSGSPQQMFPALADFVSAQGFPDGTLHLREIDLSHEIFGKGGGTAIHKSAVISGLIEDFPERRFVLIGDSGEQDPEIYGALARQFPQAINAIWIRDVSAEPRDSQRYVDAFADVDAGRWQIFRSAAELALQ